MILDARRATYVLATPLSHPIATASSLYAAPGRVELVLASEAAQHHS